jgi:hypothetical protein
MRAFKREVLAALDLRATGMEFASEMVIRAAKEGVAISQLPVTYHPRRGESKLSSFRDGWRHLRFLLVHSPMYLFALPGATLGILGSLIVLTVVARIEVFGRAWDIHAMVAGCLLMIVAVQILALGLCARTYGRYFLGEQDARLDRMRARLRLEHGLLAGAGIILAGLVMLAVIVATWIDRGFGRLAEERLAVLGATLVIIGVQVFFSAFLVSILGLRRRD